MEDDEILLASLPCGTTQNAQYAFLIARWMARFSPGVCIGTVLASVGHAIRCQACVRHGFSIVGCVIFASEVKFAFVGHTVDTQFSNSFVQCCMEMLVCAVLHGDAAPVQDVAVV